jgi:hypothetical protein
VAFFKGIMSKLGGGRSSRAPFINLGAFGKHPGWDDHIDDLGLESPQLINAKRIFYVQGMSGNIDSGAWDHLSDEDQLKQFRHVFAFRVGDDLIIGRLWSSSDGKGRKRYPMIVCAHCGGVPMPWAFANVLPTLEKIEIAVHRRHFGIHRAIHHRSFARGIAKPHQQGPTPAAMAPMDLRFPSTGHPGDAPEMG